MKKMIMLATVALTVFVADDETFTEKESRTLIEDTLLDANINQFDVKNVEIQDAETVESDEVKEIANSNYFGCAVPLMSYDAKDEFEQIGYNQSDDEDLDDEDDTDDTDTPADPEFAKQ